VAKIGSWGSCVFEVSRKKVLSFNNLSKTVENRWNDHEIIGRKPKTEFNGVSLGTGSLDIVLDASLGVKPMNVLKTLEKAVEKGTANYLVIGKNKIGNCKWVINSLSEEYDTIYSNGAIAKISLTINIKEYN
jgi:phage protein U